MDALYIKPELSPKIIQTNEPILVTEIFNLQEFSVTSVAGQAQQILSKLRKIQTPKVCVRGQSNPSKLGLHTESPASICHYSPFLICWQGIIGLESIMRLVNLEKQSTSYKVE
ncbi:core-binding factor subunit beta [Platysternon megacephalum]|uniref:Core-binding factor subunit beta n=1 Tax=Platysternon megacephalum TaxID=55544 RepID=A0A4D9E172_9SAUR|nr:core-binding factor subunit beta [Platysternon megacephalum]